MALARLPGSMTGLGGNPRGPWLALALAAGLLLLAGCGGDGDGGDEDEASDAAVEALTSTDPSVCTDRLTEQYRQQTQLSKGDFAIKACEQELEFTAADSAEVRNIEIDGDKATVDVAHTGSAFDGQVVSYEMVKEDGEWKLDLLTGFADFNRAAFANALDTLAKEAAGVNPPGVECYNNQLKALNEQQLEDLYTSGDFREYSKLYEKCS